MIISEIFEFLQLLDSDLYYYIEKFGIYIYFLLFAIVFGKTGFVILTFLPGDSLVFASGAIAAMDQLSLLSLFFIFFIATSLADSNNYLIGKSIRNIPSENSRLMKIIPIQTLDKARIFLNDYDKVAITFSRFIPLMRTMMPFIAGFTGYSYRSFVSYNVLGAFVWTSIWLGTGFAFGNMSWVKGNLLFTLSFITIVMFIPSICGFVVSFKKNKLETKMKS
ncbi:membrane-associated protein [Lysinibacillus composti]|uniref:DedA family protein n=1 Tax=Lysinibacillus composti TaxID=720633 RepID=UPI001EF86E10|nr:VTT domain-containing protein [Lysinibacillus composti]MBM7607184.1 membrane-associated protein [Lysinibacillus composti]